MYKIIKWTTNYFIYYSKREFILFYIKEHTESLLQHKNALNYDKI